MKNTRILIAAVAALAFASSAFGQSAIVRGEVSAGTYETIKSTSQALNVNISSGLSPAAAALADAAANPTTTTIGADNSVFNGTTWDRWRSVGVADAAGTGLGAIGNYIYNGATWDRWRSALGSTGIANVSTEGIKTTYSASAVAFVPVTGATDVFCIAGSASKTIKVSRVSFSGAATAGTSTDVTLIKRAAVDTGGTSASATKVPIDSGSAAATATVVSYTGNPTINNTVGVIRSARGAFMSLSGNAVSAPVSWEFGTRNSQFLTLRGVAEQACVNLNAVALAGGQLANADVEWTEE